MSRSRKALQAVLNISGLTSKAWCKRPSRWMALTTALCVHRVRCLAPEGMQDDLRSSKTACILEPEYFFSVSSRLFHRNRPVDHSIQLKHSHDVPSVRSPYVSPRPSCDSARRNLESPSRETRKRESHSA